MTRSGSRSHKSYQEGVPEVIPGSGTGSCTGRHDQKWYQKAWPKVVSEAITYEQIRYGHDEFIANYQTDRQNECFTIANITFYNWGHHIADISSNTSSGNGFDTGRQKSGRIQNPGRGNEQGECTLLISICYLKKRTWYSSRWGFLRKTGNKSTTWTLSLSKWVTESITEYFC